MVEEIIKEVKFYCYFMNVFGGGIICFGGEVML